MTLTSDLAAQAVFHMFVQTVGYYGVIPVFYVCIKWLQNSYGWTSNVAKLSSSAMGIFVMMVAMKYLFPYAYPSLMFAN